MMSSEALLAHAYQLANDNGISVIPTWAVDLECDDCPCGASTHLLDRPMVWVSETPNTAESYLVFLHELGHHLAVGADPGNVELWREESAWGWAEEKSIIPITPHLRAFIERRLDSYRD